MIAALYVLARGPYANMPGVDPWPAKRNALLYRGPDPVVAFPPCAWWSRSVRRQVKLSSAQGPHLAPTAITQVQEFGGAMEQPAGSILWETMGLPYPDPYRQLTIDGPERDEHGGFTVELYQGDWADRDEPLARWAEAWGPELIADIGQRSVVVGRLLAIRIFLQQCLTSAMLMVRGLEAVVKSPSSKVKILKSAVVKVMKEHARTMVVNSWLSEGAALHGDAADIQDHAARRSVEDQESRESLDVN